MRAIIFIEARGKIPAWTRIAAALGIDARVVSTDGHLCEFPDRLHPLGIRMEGDRALNCARVPRPEALSRVRRAVKGRRDGTDILIATDDDPEGDAIALDVMNAVVETDPALAGACLRVRPGAIDRETVRSAIARAYGDGRRPNTLVAEAAGGRSRSLADRWIGAAFSRMARAPCGRVRAGLLGAALGWSRVGNQAVGLPETGEITFQARSDAGGPPYTAHVPLRGGIPRSLAAVAERHAGRPVPGHVSPAVPAGAAVVPRFGEVESYGAGLNLRLEF